MNESSGISGEGFWHKMAIYAKIRGKTSGGNVVPTMNISLTDQLKDFVDAQVNSGRYTSVSEYVRELLRTDQKRHEKEELEIRLLEGLKSGEAVEITPAMWEDLRKNLRKRAKRAS